MGNSIPRLDMETLFKLLKFSEECRSACIARGEQPMKVQPEWLAETR